MTEEKPKAKRGRPRKTDAEKASADAAKATEEASEAPKRKRGRPRKNPLPEEAAASAPAAEAKPEAGAPSAEASADHEASAKSSGERTFDRSERNSNANNRRNNQKNNQKNQGKQNNNNHRRQRRQHGNNYHREPVVPQTTREDLEKLKVAELREKADELGVDHKGLKKAELVDAVLDASVKAEGFVETAGVLDILSDGATT